MSDSKVIDQKNNIAESNQAIQQDIHRAKSMYQIVSKQFLEHRFAVASSIVIAFFLVVALSASLIEKVFHLDPNEQDVFNRYKPMRSRIDFSTEKKDSQIEAYSIKHQADVTSLFSALKSQTVIDLSDIDFEQPPYAVLSSLSGFMDEDNQFAVDLAKLNIPAMNNFIEFRKTFSTYHLFGTDELGRDVLIRLIYGARVSIGIGLTVALASAVIGLFIGSLAGYYGGILDSFLMRITDALLSIPTLPLLIVFAAVDLNKIPIFKFVLGTEGESIFKLVVILCLFSWMTVARLVRGSILTLKEQDFIHAAKTLGARDKVIILKHLLPNVIAPLLVSVTLNIGQSILSEAALSFLGLGVQPPVPTWGNMLFNAQELIYEAPSLALIPGFLIFVVVISFNFIGDGLQDAIDPKAIRR